MVLIKSKVLPAGIINVDCFFDCNKSKNNRRCLVELFNNFQNVIASKENTENMQSIFPPFAFGQYLAKNNEKMRAYAEKIV